MWFENESWSVRHSPGQKLIDLCFRFKSRTKENLCRAGQGIMCFLCYCFKCFFWLESRQLSETPKTNTQQRTLYIFQFVRSVWPGWTENTKAISSYTNRTTIFNNETGLYFIRKKNRVKFFCFFGRTSLSEQKSQNTQAYVFCCISENY